MPIEIFVDHTGPMTETVAGNALMLRSDRRSRGYDQRQFAESGEIYGTLGKSSERNLKTSPS